MVSRSESPANPGIYAVKKLTRCLALLLHQADRVIGSGFGMFGGGVAWQYGHRGRRRARPMVRRRRMVGMEVGAWRSGRNGGRAGSVTTGKVYGAARPPAGCAVWHRRITRKP